jgi:hypothetical protein
MNSHGNSPGFGGRTGCVAFHQVWLSSVMSVCSHRLAVAMRFSFIGASDQVKVPLQLKTGLICGASHKVIGARTRTAT